MEHVALIYRLLALSVAIDEANLVVDRLGLPQPRISHTSQLTEWEFSTPRDGQGDFRGFSGYVRTKRFHFGFTQGSRLPALIVMQLDDHGAEDYQDDDGRQGVPKESVNDKLAYRLAHDWLCKLGMDVAEMERKHHPKVEHRKLFPPKRGLVSSRFVVRWGGRDIRSETAPWPVAEVYLNASKTQLARIYILGWDYYRHRIPEVPHAIAINMLPDEPVRKCLAQNRSYYTNAFVLLERPEAYEERQSRLMLEQGRIILSKLGWGEVNESTVSEVYVNPPAFGSGGRLAFPNGEMHFNEDGRLDYFHFVPPGVTNYVLWQQTAKSQTSTNRACELALEKLASLSMDVERLDRDLRRTVYGGQLWRHDKRGRLAAVDTPEVWVVWSEPAQLRSPAMVTVGVYGDSVRVGRLEIKDTSHWKESFLPASAQQKE